MAVVIPAWRLAALLNQEHLVKQREKLFQSPGPKPLTGS